MDIYHIRRGGHPASVRVIVVWSVNREPPSGIDCYQKTAVADITEGRCAR